MNDPPPSSNADTNDGADDADGKPEAEPSRQIRFSDIDGDDAGSQVGTSNNLNGVNQTESQVGTSASRGDTVVPGADSSPDTSDTSGDDDDDSKRADRKDIELGTGKQHYSACKRSDFYYHMSCRRPQDV